MEGSVSLSNGLYTLLPSVSDFLCVFAACVALLCCAWVMTCIISDRVCCPVGVSESGLVLSRWSSLVIAVGGSLLFGGSIEQLLLLLGSMGLQSRLLV